MNDERRTTNDGGQLRWQKTALFWCRRHLAVRRSPFAGQPQRGLTLAELMMALPIATIIIIVLLTALFTQYTSVLAEAARSNLRTNGQTLLINMQDELLFTIAFGETMDFNLSDPYAPSGGWVHNSSPQTLIINEIALDSTRRDEDRHIVRQQLNVCESSGITTNPVSLNNVIYFVEDDPDSEYDRLVRRTLTPSYATCSIDLVTGDPCTPTTSTCRDNAKSTSCPVAHVGTGQCEVADSVLSENVTDMSITYFAENNVVTTSPSSADKIEVTLTLADRVYGREVTTDVKHTIRKIN